MTARIRRARPASPEGSARTARAGPDRPGACRRRRGAARAPPSDPFDGDEVRSRGALAEGTERLVLGVLPEGAERRHARELDDDEAGRMPGPLEHLVRTSAREVTASVRLDELGDRAAVLGEPLGV